MTRVRRGSLQHHIFLQALDLYAKGYTQMQIAEKLHLSQQKISKMLLQIRQESIDMLPHYLTQIVPWEIRRSLLTYDMVQQKASELIDHSDPRIKQLGLSLVMNVTSERNSLLSSLHGVNEAIQAIKQAMLRDNIASVDRMITEAEHDEQARIKHFGIPSSLPPQQQPQLPPQEQQQQQRKTEEEEEQQEGEEA